jgi:uncharacterized protein YceH (UPF0502 family)
MSALGQKQTSRSEIAPLSARSRLTHCNRKTLSDPLLARASSVVGTSSIYFEMFLECDARKSWWSKRIASHKNRITNAIAAAGIARARKDISSAPPSSAVAITELPRPPVQAVE